ncbi:MAG: hypothetical protein C0623_05690 [Desulfuromonas sp.]|nr:MAG: hypothetical protein C0623_05690 [Desulfuromonas sp.]
MEEWLQHLFNWLPDDNIYYFSIGMIAFMESLVLIGVIVPGSTIIVFTGFLALHGKGDIVTIVTASVFGAFWGDFLSYWLGARSGPAIINSRVMRKQKKLVLRAEAFFAAHGGKSVFFGRFFGPIRGFIPFVAGGAKMKLRAFIGYAIISAILWGISYPGLGYLAGVSWQNVQRWSGRFALVIFAALIITILVTWLRRRYR